MTIEGRVTHADGRVRIWITTGTVASGMLVSVELFIADLSFYNSTFAVGDSGHPFSNSLFGGAKALVTLLFGDEARREFAEHAFRPWTLVAVGAHVGAMFYVHRRGLEFWRAMTVLVCVSLLFMPVSADYRLLWVLVPCALFLSEAATIVPRERLIAVLFGLVLVPKGFSLLPWVEGPAVATNVSAVLSPLVIGALLIAVLSSPQSNHDHQLGAPHLDLGQAGG